MSRASGLQRPHSLFVHDETAGPIGRIGSKGSTALGSVRQGSRLTCDSLICEVDVGDGQHILGGPKNIH